jgi:hypothetical protein
MRIEIDYNGACAQCKISKSNDPEKMMWFNEADRFDQLYAMQAFECIKQHWKREQNK